MASALPLSAARPFSHPRAVRRQPAIAERIVAEIVNRLQFLNNVGLNTFRPTAPRRALRRRSAAQPLASQIGSDHW
jgi:excinuclease UvrABC ATPase subunit